MSETLIVFYWTYDKNLIHIKADAVAIIIHYYSVRCVSPKIFFLIRQHFSYRVRLTVTSTLHDISIKFLVRALPCSIFHLKLPRATRKKASTKVRKVGEIWCMPRGVFLKEKKETISSFSHGSDFGDCDGTKPRFRRVTLQRPPSRYSPPTACLFFRDTRRHWFSNSIFAFYPATRTVSGVAPPSILEFSTFPSSVHPFPANS